MPYEPRAFPFRFATMARFIGTANIVGADLRAACLLVMVPLAVVGHAGWRLLQLALCATGLILAWFEADEPRLVRALKSGRLLRVIGEHFLAAKDAATATLSGVLEALGVISAALLFAGPWPLTMPQPARVVVLVVLALYATIAFGQIVTDPGYFSAEHPAGPLLVLFRWSSPALVAGLGFLLFIGPTADPPVPPVAAAAIAAPILLLYPYAAVIELLVGSAEESARRWVDAVSYDERDQHAEAVHTAKTDIRGRQLLSRDGPAFEAEAYDHALLAIERARRQILHDQEAGADQSLADVWSVYRAILDSAVRSRVGLTDQTAGCVFGPQSAQIITFALIDLVGNALRATPGGVVEVAVGVRAGTGSRMVRVTVDDDGTGSTSLLFAPESSVATLRRICRARAGDVILAESPRGGLRAVAQFCDADPRDEFH